MPFGASQSEWQKLEEERRYQEWWAYVYASCSVKDRLRRDEGLLAEIEKLFLWLRQVDYKYDLISTYARDDESIYLGNLVKLANSLVYSYHKTTIKDGLHDLVYEQMVTELGNPFGNLDSDERAVVEKLHQLSLKFGFLVVALLICPPIKTNWRAFVELEDEAFQLIKDWLCFPYRSRGEYPKYFQILTPPYGVPIEEPWDVVIFYDIGNNDLDRIKQRLETILLASKTQRSGRKRKTKKIIIGNNEKYSFALYFQRSKVNLTRVMNLLSSQIQKLTSYSSGAGDVLLSPLEPIIFDAWLVEYKRKRKIPPFRDKYMPQNKHPNEFRWCLFLPPFRYQDIPELKAGIEKYNREVEQHNDSVNALYRATSDAKKLGEGLLGRKRPLDKDNFRRAVAIEIWQNLPQATSLRKTGKSKAVKEVIEWILANNQEAIEYYRPKYFHYILKDGTSAHDSETKRDPIEGYPADDFRDERYCDVPGEKELLEREFYIDIELTERCVEQADYLRVGNVRQTKTARSKKDVND